LVGPLELSYERLPIPDTDRQMLTVCHASPGSATAQAIALLAATATAQREPMRSFQTE
jgi:hypothetical protein